MIRTVHNAAADIVRPAAHVSRREAQAGGNSRRGSATPFQNLLDQTVQQQHAVAPGGSIRSQDATKPYAAAPATVSEGPKVTTSTDHPGASIYHPSWEENVRNTSPGGTESRYNLRQFASADSAAVVAQKLGGRVVESQFLGGFAPSSPQRLITGAGANDLNAGLVAELFQKYGDAPGSEAWRVIRRDLGHYDSPADVPPVVAQILAGFKT